MPFPIFNTQAEIPEPFRADYEERDGKWHPKVESSADELAAEKRKRAALLEEKRQEKEKREAAERERDELKRIADAKAQGITEEQLQKIREDEAKARKPLEDKLAATETRLRQVMLTDRVKTLALAAGVMPDRIAKAMKDLDGRVDLAEGGDSIVVKDAAGNVTAETIEDFLGKTYKAEAPFFYVGAGASGSGAEGSHGSGADRMIPLTDAKVRNEKRSQVAGAF